MKFEEMLKNYINGKDLDEESRELLISLNKYKENYEILRKIGFIDNYIRTKALIDEGFGFGKDSSAGMLYKLGQKYEYVLDKVEEMQKEYAEKIEKNEEVDFKELKEKYRAASKVFENITEAYLSLKRGDMEAVYNVLKNDRFVRRL